MRAKRRRVKDLVDDLKKSPNIRLVEGFFDYEDGKPPSECVYCGVASSTAKPANEPGWWHEIECPLFSTQEGLLTIEDDEDE